MIGRRIAVVSTLWLLLFALPAGCEGVLKGGQKEGERPTQFDSSDAADASRDAGCAGAGCTGSGEQGPQICGDGVQQVGEECDDGNVTSADGCDNRCVAELAPLGPVCGDGLLDTLQEECDDGNTVSGDGCNRRCNSERCGNHRRDVGEECDPPETGYCDRTCKRILPNCGDGELQNDEGEQCDDGNETRGDGCFGCRVECGDGVLERDIGEECEPIYALPGTCDEETCLREALCGDGKVDEEAGEQCDPSDGVTCVECRYSLDAGADAGVDPNQCYAEGPQVAIVNATFDDSTDGWTPAHLTVTATHSLEGWSRPGSVEVSYTAGVLPNASVDGVVQCVPVAAGARYTLLARYYNPASNPEGVLPGISVRLYSQPGCEGSFMSGSGPAVSSTRDSWVPFLRSIDTSVLGEEGTGSMLLKLGVVVPEGVAAGTLRFDDVALGRCGNCLVEGEAGEQCDDGNSASGDGCSPSCEYECGNGQLESPEQCDDGNFAYGDSCTPSCRSPDGCDGCTALGCMGHVDACLALEGVASSGPGVGKARAALCSELRDCIHDTGCNLNTAIANAPTLGGASPSNPSNPGLPENCYCGNSGVDCLTPGQANGSCRQQIEAALETQSPYQVIQRVGGFDPQYPLFDAVVDLLACETNKCGAQCIKPLACGNGYREDRSLDFVSQFRFLINRLPTPCDDSYTQTQAGCSFEECDDGNLENGDGCDEDCFLEACGNYLKQGGEECDDGNLEDGDGCGHDCVAEFVCGDDAVTAPFEECEPPNTGSVCSMTEYDADSTQCGCDEGCIRKVCGNYIVQEGEECDPPNGTSCDTSCQRSVDECTECMLLLDDYQFCPADLLFNGSGVPDQFQTGCLSEPSCMNLWGCMRDTRCHEARGVAACYCGATADFNQCESPTFVPTGECKQEFLDAFQKQRGREPNNNAELLAGSILSTGTNNPYSLATYVVQYCLAPDSSEAVPALRIQLEQSGVSSEEADACVDACFP